jgi:hypothetical protein
MISIVQFMEKGDDDVVAEYEEERAIMWLVE